jgi:hypothetical protein
MAANDRLIADTKSGCFAVAICSVCEELPTQHRCLATVKFGGLLYGPVGQQRVCAEPICAPCNARFGNENIVHCVDHSNEKENCAGNNKGNHAAGKKVTAKTPSNANKMVEYSGLANKDSTSLAVAGALSKFADLFAEGLKQWNQHNVFANATPAL